VAVRSSAARKLKGEPDSQLAAVNDATGRDLRWTPTESQLIEQVLDAIDRKTVLQQDWNNADDPDSRVRISAEMRLLDAHAERVLRRIVVPTPEPAKPQSGRPRSSTSRKAAAAAESRWNRERLNREHGDAG
jgi:hypothetical protein